MLVYFNLIIIVVLSLVLYKASVLLIQSIRQLSHDGFIGKFVLAGIFAGFATSIPELFIGVTSALEGKTEIAFGTAIGSNIANLGLVFPLAILLSGIVLIVHREDFSLKTILLLLTSSLFPFLLALNGGLSRINGLFLMLLFAVYSIYIFNKRSDSRKANVEGLLHRIDLALHRSKTRLAFLKLIGAVILLMVSSHFLVNSALFLSEALSVNPFLIAVFIIAPGTSLPELFVALTSIKHREFDVLYGDIFGSLITNANLVIGLSVFIHPFRLIVFPGYLLSLLGLLGVFTLFILFSMTKEKFERWEAGILLAFYFLFFVTETLF